MNSTTGKLILLSLTIILLSSSSWSSNKVEGCLEKGIFEQIGCLSDLAAKYGDASVCDSATHEGVKYQCYAVTAEKIGDWHICLEIPKKSKEHLELRDICISDVAEKNVDSDVCEKIQTGNFKDSCYLKVYRKAGDSVLCDKISDPGIKSLCTGEPVMVE